MYDSQCGAVKGKGSDLATHVVCTIVDHAMLYILSICILLVDLVQAFDRAVRDVAFGWNSLTCNDKVTRSQSIGLSADQAASLAEQIDREQPVFNRAGVDPDVVTLLTSLHESSWFAAQDSESFLVASRGGRQGCKFGAKVFNVVYSELSTKSTGDKGLRASVSPYDLPAEDLFWATLPMTPKLTNATSLM